jgi:hypothetical protein
MAIVPKKIADKIGFYQERAPVWAASATALGLSAGEMTLMSGKVAEAVDALADDTAAKSAAKAATIRLHDAVADMGKFGADLISKIKGKAGQDGNSVYAIALLPVPATPGPIPAPGMPEGLKVELKPNGSLLLKWKCENAPGSTGVFYYVWRRTGESGEYAFLGASGAREFSDTTVPMGVASVTYQIQAARTTSKGDAAYFLVQFGTTAGGGMTVSAIKGDDGPKKAAA